MLLHAPYATYAIIDAIHIYAIMRCCYDALLWRCYAAAIDCFRYADADYAVFVFADCSPLSHAVNTVDIMSAVFFRHAIAARYIYFMPHVT